MIHEHPTPHPGAGPACQPRSWWGLYEPQETRTRCGSGTGSRRTWTGERWPGIEELHRVLDEAQERSRLPEAATALQGLHDLVVRARLAP
ncbi:hypothetical protein [Streptomyces microflavus]|uniref:hypothetical protein n=1 Tax=Streptomyces microflavus TaxID=1919 RepID=UPI0033F16A5F